MHAIRRRSSVLEFMTGKSHWEKRKVKHGTIVLASDNLILLTEGGEAADRSGESERVCADGYGAGVEGSLLDGADVVERQIVWFVTWRRWSVLTCRLRDSYWW